MILRRAAFAMGLPAAHLTKNRNITMINPQKEDAYECSDLRTVFF